ncbi:MAG: RluA family pseudouridine synthase [Treponema sp.]|jgi:23S rRNA pseudouridine955/2504/2580 synthase|nr:RluA family pseudouridine synthase [Treponema sp.]
MIFRQFTAGPDDEGRRFDTVIRKLTQGANLSGAGLSGIYSAIRKGVIKLNGKKAAPDARVHPGDYIETAEFLFSASEEQNGTVAAIIPCQIETLFENNTIQVLNKPYGVPVQGTKRESGIAGYCRQAFEARRGTEGNTASLSFVPAPLHRLDRETTGVLVCSRSLEGARWFSAALRGHQVRKVYLGITEGTLAAPEVWIDCCDGKSAKTSVIPLGHGMYQKICVTFAAFDIETGRKHQIRSHSSRHGFPLFGDTRYGGRAIHQAQGYYLHAWKLWFPSERPEGIPALVTAPVPVAFRIMLDKFLVNFEAVTYNV